MAAQGCRKRYKVNLAPSVGDKPEGGVPSNPVPEPKLASGEILDEHGGRDTSEDAGSPDKLEPEGPTPGAAVRVEESDALQLAFPRKLWMIVENDAFKSVRWSDSGNTVIIEKDLFQREVLRRRGAERIFEMDSLKAFNRQLNLHGFIKIRPSKALGKTKVMVYRNCNFKRDQPLLLQNIKRRRQAEGSAQPAKAPTLPAPAAPPPKRKKLAATRHSARIQQKNAIKESKGASPKNPPDVLGPSPTPSVRSSSISSVSSVAEASMEQPPLAQCSVPSWESTSHRDMFEPQVSAGMVGEGEPLTEPGGYSDPSSVMTLYNACYSILLAGLSVMAPEEPSDPQGDSPSDYHCSICEQFRDEQAP
ncbi:heat shock transcription factor, X-linked member 3-like [Elephas maximus indicus]|uniref:heat shock transcription factor, X-linked member 3-like n=1 Tax=Elephas maximus indicus TaxID=99487 RepID=UPI0021160277|nr:heat shock transcription factor, X-linked member 3-like [Elephas maximus indicus]